jgi:hypothetical protein
MHEVFQVLKEKNFKPRLLYSAKLLFITRRTIKTLHDKEKLKQFLTTNSVLQKIIKGTYTKKMEVNTDMKVWE